MPASLASERATHSLSDHGLIIDKQYHDRAVQRGAQVGLALMRVVHVSLRDRGPSYQIECCSTHRHGGRRRLPWRLAGLAPD